MSIVYWSSFNTYQSKKLNRVGKIEFFTTKILFLNYYYPIFLLIQKEQFKNLSVDYFQSGIDDTLNSIIESERHKNGQKGKFTNF